ncbi:hypothetical protein BV25DRAFT_1836293 [Artomyces pyxidatus]|uniref:Uncharacterized protein n=1 Tax=Artomyces pyxidatus TaxID=48021 RepID=A0ACB8T9I5_9AGAM|nr:hypothetical protein BV25DRAFT_1836293 [Artomyces pyxidatus]
MNAFPNGTRVTFWHANGQLRTGTVRGTSIQADGTQIVVIQVDGEASTHNSQCWPGNPVDSTDSDFAFHPSPVLALRAYLLSNFLLYASPGTKDSLNVSSHLAFPYQKLWKRASMNNWPDKSCVYTPWKRYREEASMGDFEGVTEILHVAVKYMRIMS